MNQKELTLEQAIELAAVDGMFFCHYFLSKSFCLEPAITHCEVWDVLNNIENELICLEMFRDGAKTTILRGYALWRIAFGATNLVQFLSESEGHSVRSISWIRNRINDCKLLREVFQLEIGDTDNKSELQVINGRYKTKTTLTAKGVTGQVRGTNEDDNRPDLIICDDIQTMENAGTPDTLTSINETFFGSVVPARAARSVHRFSTVVLLGTRVAKEDVIGLCQLDPQWTCRKFSVFLDNGESAWPTKWSTEQLKEDKAAAGKRRMLSLWLREKECQLVRAEETAFANNWAQRYIIVPQQRAWFLACDPVPPPSEKQLAEGLKKKDNEVWSVIAASEKKYYLEDQIVSKGHEPDWSVNTFFTLLARYKPRACGIETIGYQRTLKSLIESEMKKRRQYTQVIGIEDYRKKYYRLTQELGVAGSNGLLYVHDRCIGFLQEFEQYPGTEHDDHLDSAAIGIMTIKKILGYLYDSADGAESDQAIEDPYEQEFQLAMKDSREGVSRCP